MDRQESAESGDLFQRGDVNVGMLGSIDTASLHWQTRDATVKASESDSSQGDRVSETQMESGPLVDFTVPLDNGSPLPPPLSSSHHSSFSHLSGAARSTEKTFPATSGLDASNPFFAHTLSRENNIEAHEDRLRSGNETDVLQKERAPVDSGAWGALSKQNDFFRPGHHPVVPLYDRLFSCDGQADELESGQALNVERRTPTSLPPVGVSGDLGEPTCHGVQNAESLHQHTVSSPQASLLGADHATVKPRSEEPIPLGSGFSVAPAVRAEDSDHTRGLTHQSLPNRYAHQTEPAYHNSTSSLSLPRHMPAKPSMPHGSADDVVASSALRDWEQRHEGELEGKRQEEIQCRKRLQEEAQRQLEAWYKENSQKKEARHQANVVEESRQKDAQAPSSARSNGEGESLPESEMSWTCVRNLLLQASTGSGLPLAISQNGSHSRGATRSVSHTRRGSPAGQLETPVLTSSTAASTSSSSSVFDKRKTGGEETGAVSSWGVGDKDTMRMRRILDTLAERERAARG